MKKMMLFLSLMSVTAWGFAENLVLENLTAYPNKKVKMAIQWANTAKEVVDGNNAVIYGLKLNPATFQALSQPGKIHVVIPKQAEYFRVLVWSKGEEEPDLLTNWVDALPNKVYKLKQDHLVPAVLMGGAGC